MSQWKSSLSSRNYYYSHFATGKVKQPVDEDGAPRPAVCPTDGAPGCAGAAFTSAGLAAVPIHHLL